MKPIRSFAPLPKAKPIHWPAPKPAAPSPGSENKASHLPQVNQPCAESSLRRDRIEVEPRPLPLTPLLDGDGAHRSVVGARFKGWDEHLCFSRADHLGEGLPQALIGRHAAAYREAGKAGPPQRLAGLGDEHIDDRLLKA